MVKGFDISEIATKLNSMTCELHKKSATVTVSGNDLNFDGVCCNDFFKVLNEQYKTEMELQITMRINNMMKKN